MICEIEEYIDLINSDDHETYRRPIIEELSSSLIDIIIQDYPQYHMSFIQNKLIPLYVLHQLSESKFSNVRLFIAMKRKCDRILFEKLIRDGDSSVRKMVALNAKLPIDLLKKLTQDKDSFVSEAAKERLNEISKE